MLGLALFLRKEVPCVSWVFWGQWLNTCSLLQLFLKTPESTSSVYSHQVVLWESCSSLRVSVLVHQC